MFGYSPLPHVQSNAALVGSAPLPSGQALGSSRALRRDRLELSRRSLQSLGDDPIRRSALSQYHLSLAKIDLRATELVDWNSSHLTSPASKI